MKFDNATWNFKNNREMSCGGKMDERFRPRTMIIILISYCCWGGDSRGWTVDEWMNDMNVDMDKF